MKRLFSVLAVLLVLAVPVRADEAPAKPVAVPFELLKSGHMATMIKVNGKGPYRVIFDTGAPITILNNKVAKQAGLLDNVPRPLFTLFGSMGQVNVAKLEVGTVKAEKVEAIVMDHPTVAAISRVLGPIEGIVGFPFFARYKMTIDYQARQMTFVPSGYQPPDVVETIMASLATITHEKEPVAKVIAPAAQWGLVVRKAKDAEAGVVIQQVLPGSSAAAAGFKAGDRLLTLDGRWTDTVADCYTAASNVKPGTSVKVTIKRDAKEIEFTVKPSSGL